MPPGVSGRRTAPDAMDGDHHWYPTMEEFKDFKTYMEYLESQGAHEKGVALVHVSSYYVYALHSVTFSKESTQSKISLDFIAQKYEKCCHEHNGIIVSLPRFPTNGFLASLDTIWRILTMR